MKEITFYGTKITTLQQFFLEDDFFLSLVHCFLKEPEQSLREIKKELNVSYELDKYVERLIEAKLLTRKEGKYSLSFPIFMYTNESIKETIQISADKFIQELAEHESTLKKNIHEMFLLTEEVDFSAIISYYLLKIYQEKNVLFGFTGDITLYKKEEILGDKFHFITILPNNSHTISLPIYFREIEKQNNLDSIKFKELLTKIGDVHAKYFVDNCGAQLRKIIKNPCKKQKKYNLFIDSLVDLGYISSKELCYDSHCTFLEEKKGKNDDLILDSLNKLNLSIIEKIGDANPYYGILFISSVIKKLALNNANIVIKKH